MGADAAKLRGAELTGTYPITDLTDEGTDMQVSTEDYLAIKHLYSTYNHMVDIVGDAAGVADCFIEDGVYDHGRYGRIQGRAQIITFMQRAIDRQLGFQHLNDNLLIDTVGDEATATAYVLTVDGSAAPPVIARSSIYRDSLIKTEDGWRFRSRRVGYPVTEFRQ